MLNQENNSRSEIISKTAKTGGIVFGIYYLFKMIFKIVFLIGVILILMLIGLPWYIGVPFIVLAIILVIMQAIKIKRIASTKL